MRLKKILSMAIVTGGMTIAMQANAIIWQFDNVGDSYTANYSAVENGSTINANISWTLNSWTQTSAIFSIVVDNSGTTEAGLNGDNRLVSFGIDVIDPSLSGVTATGDWSATRDATFPGFQTVELCAWAGQNCAGGAGDGVFGGQTDSFNLTLNTLGDFQASGITFTSPFPAQFQSVGLEANGPTSYQFNVSSSSTSGAASTTSGGTLIPEPAILGLLGIGLLAQAFAFASRRRRLDLQNQTLSC
jgi:hypothetical protein